MGMHVPVTRDPLLNAAQSYGLPSRRGVHGATAMRRKVRVGTAVGLDTPPPKQGPGAASAASLPVSLTFG